MKNSEYWEKRIAEPTWNTYNSLEEKNRALLEMYQEASLSISDELYRVAEKMKTSTPMLSDMHKFNRLTNLQNNINSIIKELGSNVESFGKQNMYKGFSENYKATMEAIGEVSFDLPNKKLMEKILNRPWKGSNFSERLWKNTKVLAMNLNDILTTGLTQGKTITEMAIQLNNRMNEGFNVAHKLVRTETMHYLNESSFKAYQDAGCEEVQVWAAADERTCPTCSLRHGNVYKMKDRPLLPFHANCRCTYLPVVDEVTKVDAPINIDGEEIKFNLDDMKVEKQDEVKETITELAKQYNTRLKSVSKGRDSNGTKGFVGMDFNMTLATSLKNTVVHEFAHSLSSTKTEKLNLTDDKEFWKEIKKVRTKYNKATRENINKKISSYADESIDEFMAEAFTHSYLKNTKYLGWEYGSDYEYSDMVLKIINKYFKKLNKEHLRRIIK
ncbi:TPA: phage head morphogenesis protein [Clostridium perfringens]|uniref:Phage head morphogenesis protein n=1 Tax=Clostridium perfringens TaxID=1502 RepID=A0A8H9UVY9_CLOPF|nr:phage head morphogenesis protein [Clostridium perfringens]